MERKKVFFRADGNNTIGLGHLTRCLAIAEILKPSFDCIFATRFVSDYLINEIEKHCVTYRKLPENDIDHYDLFLNQLTGQEIVVLDNYFFCTEYQEKIKKKGCKLVCIDDLNDRHYVSDVVINHIPGTDSNEISCEKSTRLYLGLNYVLLRKPFLDQAQRLRESCKFDTPFISFGGSDYYNFTLRILEVLVELDHITSINVLVGDKYNHIEELEDLSGRHRKINVHRNLDSIGVLELMYNSNFAIVPASTLLLESIALKLPSITGYYVDNQIKLAKVLSNYNGIETINDFHSLNEEVLCEQLKVLRESKNCQINYIDGKSPSRIIDIFATL